MGPRYEEQSWGSSTLEPPNAGMSHQSKSVLAASFCWLYIFRISSFSQRYCEESGKKSKLDLFINVWISSI
ncbi:hypothetical protein KFK09_027136 [Dendrobium nobile]|uniref:Uncharacterized protein n=1 Tax=Dendrobium nobile TaxID=94219 RepID=A0A8T3A9K4_DENNO|nr:hypothetical protein KFK09_027136 [Dendrobium nobile]